MIKDCDCLEPKSELTQKEAQNYSMRKKKPRIIDDSENKEDCDSERVIIIHNGKAWFPNVSYNQKGFTREEANKVIELNNWNDSTVISIRDEIDKYRLQGNPMHKVLLDSECYDFDTWNSCYMNRNINVTNLPILIVSNDEYQDRLDRELERFLQEINRPPFVYNTELINAVTKNCQSIQSVLVDLVHGKEYNAEKGLKAILESYLDNEFIVNTLDKSYPFRGIAPFDELHSFISCDYKKMMEEPLTFFRIRTKEKDDSKTVIRTLGDIVHLPYDLSDRATEMRFSKAKEPCLYLGTTSFVCAKEGRWNEDSEDLYGSVFVPNEKGKTLKILNLTLSQYLIDGIQHADSHEDIGIKLQSSMLKLYPLVLAMSFAIDESGRNIKYEYLISQCLMKVMHEVGIDGIAYLSAQGEDEYQYPHGVNLALPAYDISADNKYSKYCQMFDISEPVKFDNQTGSAHKSYINKIYKKYHQEILVENFTSIVSIDGHRLFYGDTKYADYDNYLCSLERHNMQ